jgi:lysophospholipase L1-like esterase
MSRALTACGLAIAIVAALTASSPGRSAKPFAGTSPARTAKPAAGGAPGRSAKTFSAYASCGAKGRHADDFCFQGDRPVAVFRAFDRPKVAYRVCYRKRGEQKHCRDRRTRKPAQRSRTDLDVDGAGRYQLAWFAGGKAVDRDRLLIRRRTVFAIGDSLGEGTKPYLPRALSGWKVDQSVSTSRHAPEGVSILRARHGLPSVIVFALGTNDDPRSVSSFSSSISAVLDLAGSSRCVVVPDILRPPVAGTSYAGYNRALASLARRNHNLGVVDWVGLVARHRGWLAGDGVHVSATGYAARARAIANQVEQC